MKTATLKKTVFDMTPEEFKEVIRPMAEQDLQDTWDKNAYITYYDEKLCPSADTLIHEYKDHKELVRIDRNGNTTILKQLGDDHARKATVDHSSRPERRW